MRSYRHADFTINFPINWEHHEHGSQVVFAPPGGTSGSQIAYGVLANVADNWREDLDTATRQLLDQFLAGNPRMQVTGQQPARVGGNPARVTRLSGPSPLQGERETATLITVRLARGLFYAVFTVPESDAINYQATFQQIISSIRFQ